MRVLIVDNRDSFVFNLSEDLARLGATSTVVRSGIDLARLQELIESETPRLILLSPGPGHPEAAGVMIPFLASRPQTPVLGICLGMQAMACSLGGEVARAPRPAHGRSSRVRHEGDPVFAGVENGFRAGRYHSLVVTRMPDELDAIAWCDEEVDEPLVMALRHRTLPWLGLQFHPESVLSPFGTRILACALELART